MSPVLQPMAVQYYCHVPPSVSHDQYTALSLEGVLVTWYIYTFWYNFDTVLCQFLETGTSDRCLSGIVLLLRLTGFSLYPLSFFLYSPFDRYSRWRRKSSRINATMTKKEIVIVEHTKINFVIYISMLFAVILT